MGTTENERKLQKYIVQNPGIALHEGEICYYRGEAYSYRNHVVTTGSTGVGGGFSFHVAKHVTYHTGAGTSARIRENVPDYYPGVFYMTNQRLIMLSENLGFDMPIYKMTSVQTDGKMYRFFFGSKSYTIVPKEYKKIKKIMFLIEKPETPPAWENKKTSSKSSTSRNDNKTQSTVSTADEIMKYKKLLDAGAISQEEYDSVKKKLLGSVISEHTEEKALDSSASKSKKEIPETIHQEKNIEPEPQKSKEKQKPSMFSKMLGSVAGSLKEEVSHKEISDPLQLQVEESKQKKEELKPSREQKPEKALNSEVELKSIESPKIENKPKQEQEKPELENEAKIEEKKLESENKQKSKVEPKSSLFSQMLGSAVESVARSVKEEISKKPESDDFQLPNEEPLFATAASLTLDAWGHMEIGELKLYKDCLIFESDDHKFKKRYKFELISEVSAFALDNLSFIYGGKSVSFGMNNKVKKAWKKQLKASIEDFNSSL